MWDYATAFDTVRSLIADILALEEAEVTPSSRFFQDLNGESIDLLELDFRCEKEYGVNLGLPQLAGGTELVTDEGGHLTAQSLGRMKAQFPFLDFARLGDSLSRVDLTELLTVDAITRLFVSAACDTKTSSPGDNAPC